MTVRVEGFGASSSTIANLRDFATGALLVSVPLTYDVANNVATGTITIPASVPNNTLVVVDGSFESEIPSDPWFVNTGTVPCAIADNATANGGAGSVLAVLANDQNAVGASVGRISSPAHGSATNNGSSILYTPNRLYSGVDTFTYEACSATSCTNAYVSVDVEPAPCTVTSTSDAEVLYGTPGDDVICVDHRIAQVLGGAGNDLIYVHSSFAMVDPGPGQDLVIASGDPILGVASSEGIDTVDDRNPYLLYSNGTLPTLASSSPNGTTVLPDTTNPSIDVTIPSYLQVGIPAFATVTCTDDRPGVSCPATINLDTSIVSSKVLSIEAVDAAGNRTTVQREFNVINPDRIAPIVTAYPDRAPNTAGWFKAPVNVGFYATDPAPSAGTPNPQILAPVAVSTDGADQTVTSGSSCDPAGNCATGTLKVSIDTSPPTITVTGNAGSYSPTQNISIVCSATDALSGVVSSNCPTINGLGSSFGNGVHSYTVTAVDKAGNTSTQMFAFTVNPPPTITCSAPPTGWNANDVTIACTATDSDGLANPLTDSSFVLSTTTTVGVENAAASTDTRQVCDTKGQCSTAGPIVNIKIDRKGPAVTVTNPPLGALFLLGQTVNAAFSCADAGSGIAPTTGCVGTVLNGSAIDTAAVGTKTFTVVSKDVAGNVTTDTRTYVVQAAAGLTVTADYGAGIHAVGFPTPAVTIWGTITSTVPGPYVATVQWVTGGTFTPFALSNATQFVAVNVYPRNGTYNATVKVCGAGNKCGTDTVVITVGVPIPTPVAQCVTDKGATANPRYEARFGYNNTAAVPVIAPKPLVNLFTTTPLDRGQPQVLLPGSRTNIVTTLFAANATAAWSIYGVTATAKPTTIRC